MWTDRASKGAAAILRTVGSARVATALLALIAASIAGQLLLTHIAGAHFALDVPFWDDWDVLDFRDPRLANGLSLAWLFKPHNEHVIPLARLAFYGSYLLTDLDYAVLWQLSSAAWTLLFVAAFVVVCQLRMGAWPTVAAASVLVLGVNATYPDVISDQRLNFMNSLPMAFLLLAHVRSPFTKVWPGTWAFLLSAGALFVAGGGGATLVLGVLATAVWLLRARPAGLDPADRARLKAYVLALTLLFVMYAVVLYSQNHYTSLGRRYRDALIAVPWEGAL